MAVQNREDMLVEMLQNQMKVNQLLMEKILGTPTIIGGSVVSRTGGIAGNGRRPAVKVYDIKTHLTYRSQAACGMALAPEVGLSGTKPDGTPNSFVWYQVYPLLKDRLILLKDGQNPAVVTAAPSNGGTVDKKTEPTDAELEALTRPDNEKNPLDKAMTFEEIRQLTTK